MFVYTAFCLLHNIYVSIRYTLHIICHKML